MERTKIQMMKCAFIQVRIEVTKIVILIGWDRTATKRARISIPFFINMKTDKILYHPNNIFQLEGCRVKMNELKRSHSSHHNYNKPESHSVQ